MDTYDIILSAASNPTNIVFTSIIIGIIAIGLLLTLFQRCENIRFFLPSFAISVGIFGTFWGIFLGLAAFDPLHISESIPPLLEGMKTAFFTSLCGMAASLLLKLIYNFAEDSKSKGSSDPVKCLQNIESSSLSMKDSIVSLENTIQGCFKSDEEYSLVSQVKLIRQEIIDGRRDTKFAFEEFAKHFSSMASESLVKELQMVVDKFNDMLNDLVSQSFQDLKNSTERLNLWQSEYKDTIESNNQYLKDLLHLLSELEKSHQKTFERLDTLSEHFAVIEKNLSSITVSSSILEEHSTALSTQNTILQASIDEIRKAGEQAAQVVPEISQKMTTIISQIEALQAETNTFVQNTVKELKENSIELNEASTKQIQAIEEALASELTKSLSSFAGAMASLSGKFVEDYTPLTNRLRELVRMTERIDNAL